MINQIQQHNVLTTPWPLASESVDMTLTSPPYWGLRDYGVPGQIGMEPTWQEYVANIVQVCREVRRVLRPWGTLWLNLGDTYYSGKGRNGASWSTRNSGNIYSSGVNYAQEGTTRPQDAPQLGLKPKDLVGIPWRVAFALQEDGWYLRQDIVWSKANPMPESVTDRCTKAHEYIFLLAKRPDYFYDHEAIKEPASELTRPRRAKGGQKTSQAGRKMAEHGTGIKANGSFYDATDGMVERRNKRSVWHMASTGYSEAHFATFPEALATSCILAGTSQYHCNICGTPQIRMEQGWTKLCNCPTELAVPGIVFDPFMGAGTTAIQALAHGRRFSGLELNPRYITLADRRLRKEFNMFYQP